MSIAQQSAERSHNLLPTKNARGRQKFLARAGVLTFSVVVFLGGVLAGSARAEKKTIRLDAIKVEGRIQKPQAFYVLQRSNLNFEGVEFKQSFLPKILKSIEDKPF